MLQILLMSSVLAISYARSNYGNYGESRNVITVPPNCPAGQEWINGQCRDVWRSVVTPPSVYWGNPGVFPPNVITVPPNCPPGQEYINGQCRDVWRGNVPNSNVYNQIMENLWRDHVQKVQQSYDRGSPKNTADNQCPIGYKSDAVGSCRPIY